MADYSSMESNLTRLDFNDNSGRTPHPAQFLVILELVDEESYSSLRPFTSKVLDLNN